MVVLVHDPCVASIAFVPSLGVTYTEICSFDQIPCTQTNFILGLWMTGQGTEEGRVHEDSWIAIGGPEEGPQARLPCVQGACHSSVVVRT